MAKANVNLEDVSLFEETIKKEKDNLNSLNKEFSSKIVDISEQIDNEKTKIYDILEKSELGITKVTTKIDTLAQELKDLQAELITTPPTIIETDSDKDVNENNNEIPNPTYILLINKIGEIEERILVLEQVLTLLKAFQSKCIHQNKLLEEVICKIEILKDDFNNHLSKINDCSEEAVNRLRNIYDVLESYTNTNIEAPDINEVNDGKYEFLFGYRKGNKKKDVITNVDIVKCAPQLRKTKQKFNKYILNDREVVVFDHPNKTKEKLNFSQGNNKYNYDQDCGLVAFMNNLRKAGVKIDENAIVKYAIENNLCCNGGGTTPELRSILLMKCGIPCTVSTFPDAEEMAKEIEAGKLVLATVNAGVFWSLDDPEKKCSYDDYGDISGNMKYNSNHVITPYSTCRDRNGKLLGFIVCDSGRGYERDANRFMSLNDFEESIINVNGTTICYSDKAIW